MPVNVVDGVFVSPTGDDGNPGTYDQPVATITTAFLRAVRWTSTHIFIATGTYTETPSFPAGQGSTRGMHDRHHVDADAGNYSIINVGTARPRTTPAPTWRRS